MILWVLDRLYPVSVRFYRFQLDSIGSGSIKQYVDTSGGIISSNEFSERDGRLPMQRKLEIEQAELVRVQMKSSGLVSQLSMIDAHVPN